MLRKIEIENFFSFRERQVLDLTIPSKATDIDNRYATPTPMSKDRFPKVVALFGPNASGKTNLLKAITFANNFITSSFLWPKESKAVFLPFFGEHEENKPTRLFFEFDADLDPDFRTVTFQYELVLCSYGKRVLKENMRYRPEKRMKRLFERTENEINASPDFDFPVSDPVRGKIRDDASVVSTLAQFNHPFSTQLLAAFNLFQSNVDVVGRYKLDREFASEAYEAYPKCFEALKDNIRKFDFGITDIKLDKTSQGIKPRFIHAGLGMDLDYDFESQGTQNFFKIHPILWMTLKAGGVAVVDELDHDIHPSLLPEIIREYQDPETNPYNAQLIFSCHNATLLEHLEKEEVVFADKSNEGASEVYRLADIQGVRRDTNIYAKYMMGAFGAVPDIS